ncbi:MAG: hypothetical protein H6702_08660 [Myxococcales bacterium]|nr:hypothetical protein [Myxococcales bacterium]
MGRWLLALALAGCADGGGGLDPQPVDAALDGAVDGAAVDQAPPDVGPPADMAPPGCFDHRPDNENFALDGDGEPGQIHLQAAFQPGRGLWVVYNRPHPGRSDFDVWLTRVGCTPADDVPPFQVDDDAADPNAGDPSLAVHGDRVLVVWQGEVPGREPNLWVRWRLIGADGVPLGPTGRIDTGDPAQVHWMAAAEATADGFVVAGVRTGAVENRFTIFAQRLDADGAPVGPVGEDARQTGGQVEPTVGVSSGGEVRVAWLDDGQQGPVARAVLGDFGLTPLPGVAVGDQVQSKISYDRAGQWLATGVAPGDIALWPGAVMPDATPRWFGQNGTSTSPGVASGPGGGVVGWFRLDRGIRSTPFWQAFDATGVPQDVPRQIPTAEPAAPYPMALTHVGDGRYFIGWSQGVSPAFLGMGRFVRP